MTADQLVAVLQSYSRGELTSVMVMDQTGLEYGQVLDALGEHGLKLPRPNFDGINGPALRSGVEFMVAMLRDEGKS